MNVEPVLQNLVFGLFIGSNYGVAAAGLSLVFGVLRVLNVAHGELLMLGGYTSFWLFNLLGIDPFISVIISGPILLALGVGLHRGLFVFVERLDEETRIKNSLLVSFGLGLILQNLAQWAWTADERSVNTAYAGGSLLLFGLVFPYTRLAALALGCLAILALDRLLQATFIGKSIRATAEDWRAAALSGINIRRTYLITFAVGAALAGVAGSMVSIGSSIAPTLGAAWTLKALVVIVLAGMGNIVGAFGAGLLLGAAESVSTYVFGSVWREVVGLVLFLLVLLVRPQGLFGRRLR
ncbi:MAG TPA: branched-chain amino acid ABC transporter permease [Chloroflexota bacterium]|nr:branched-chain amino acid ABC transporter permease [Chloroflexota bacterium]